MTTPRAKVALNYLYLCKHHAGGKDQVALNLLDGLYNNKQTKDYVIFCYDYSVDVIKKVAPDIEIVSIKSYKGSSELGRMWHLMWMNTAVIPRLIKEHHISVIFHVGYNNGLRKLKAFSITIPHDIKAVSHRVMGKVRIPVYKYLLYRLLYHLDFKHADRIIAISDMDKAEMARFYPEFEDKLYRIYNPIKVDISQIKDDHKSKKDIVAINLQFHHKNIITLIKAFEQIMDQIDGNLILIGNVPDRVQYLKKYVVDHDLQERVKFTGFLSGSEKRKILLDSRLYVNPSLFEGFGMTAVESIIMKIPTLLSNVPANYEITKGLCNYYEPADDSNALANAIIETLQRIDSRDVLEMKSEKMLQLYDYRVIAKNYMDLFNHALDSQ